uniref:Phosphoinositide phospholipase C n=1 Tax=Grammatophora oceanica TaxID=210454 RepID=A0A7S1URX7_9STRA|mmetsp:Transcript_19291/g.28557  ORF Transcript_19291/g.28557 Transcript_19291/m.28557 type:complete len:957 (+) Transcript_19291:149-3019(+)|eukprot:CAMPEP_0194064456 /NCGR_PEP_ID=MMETSP0009_2-20130614/83077_1 /TAXON_ID=210454 /ORGANISM="Grammatophora oceanica, Strain CCMP 410" /LENGTH=956 /DNA_ID=CAMNT_0038716935 /DNA_START=70 /DNA_END=2940 /DNA_ORIENTATION=-
MAETTTAGPVTDEGHKYDDNNTTPGKTKFPRLSLKRAMSHSGEASSSPSSWTKTQTPGTLLKDAMATIELVPSNPQLSTKLLRGIRVTKITTNGKFKPRVLTISQDKFALFVTHGKVERDEEEQGMTSFMANRLPLPMISSKGISFGSPSEKMRAKFVRYIDVADIVAIHTGFVGASRKLELARGNSSHRLKGTKESYVDTKSNLLVSIVHHGGALSLDVIVPDEKTRDGLVLALSRMKQQYEETSSVLCSNEALLLRYIWYDVDTNKDGQIGEKEFATLLGRINCHVKNKTPKQLWKAYRKENNISQKYISYQDAMTILYQIHSGHYNKEESSNSSGGGNNNKTRSGIQALSLWDEIFGAEQDYVSIQDFTTVFVKGIQKETDATVEDVSLMIDAINRIEVVRDAAAGSVLEDKPGFLAKHRFKWYLHHTLNSAYDPDTQVLDESSMTKPLSHYWINTSHNTYLTGDQLQSASSVECYAKALERGCKCLELDCWDGEKHKKTKEPLPVIFHGHTVTSKILFQDVIQCVAMYMKRNHTTTYPVVLSLENHCSHEYQRAMATILQTYLGEYLYVPPDASATELPSPASLRGKIIIKGKRPPEKKEEEEEETTVDGDDDDDDDEDPYEEEETATKSNIVGDMTKMASGAVKTTTKSVSKATKVVGDTVRGGGEKSGDATPKPPKVVPELARLTLFHGVKFKGDFVQSAQTMKASHMHSISESKMGKLMKKTSGDVPNAWRAYNVKHMTRNYPAGARVDSSNYNPVLCWAMGCQMVALNFQTADTPLLLNDGRYLQNGGSGYVLKPKSVMSSSSSTNPVTLRIRVLSGYCLPKPKGAKTGETIDPYVTISIHDVIKKDGGAREAHKETSYNTETVDDNGFCPVWAETTFFTHQVQTPDVAMVKFSVNEADLGIDDQVADAVIPINCLRSGYRSILLHDKYGNRSGPFAFATLLVEIQFE